MLIYIFVLQKSFYDKIIWRFYIVEELERVQFRVIEINEVWKS